MVTILIGVAIGLVVLGVSFWTIRFLASAPPPDDEAADIVEMSVDYQCTVCGMRLTVTQAQGIEHEPPRHCMEKMAEL